MVIISNGSYEIHGTSNAIPTPSHTHRSISGLSKNILLQRGPAWISDRPGRLFSKIILKGFNAMDRRTKRILKALGWAAIAAICPQYAIDNYRK